MNDNVDDPFRTFDTIWAKYTNESLAGFIVDFHAEATSEKVAFGWYVAGRASAVLGTHTHVPTADAWVLPGETAFISDIGMTGPRDSVIGVDKDVIIRGFLTQRPVEHTIPEHGPAVVNAVVIRINPATGRALSIELDQRSTTI
jgi:calcineurin-like phosphoesterase